MSAEKIKNDPSWQSGWEGWTDDEWKDPVRVELPETTVQESTVPILQHRDTIESTDTEAGYDTANETAETGFSTDVGDTYFSANEEVTDEERTKILVDQLTPIASPRQTPSPQSCIEDETLYQPKTSNTIEVNAPRTEIDNAIDMSDKNECQKSGSEVPAEILFRDGCTIIETSKKTVVDVFDPIG